MWVIILNEIYVNDSFDRLKKELQRIESLFKKIQFAQNYYLNDSDGNEIITEAEDEEIKAITLALNY